MRAFSLMRGSTRLGYHRFPFLYYAIREVEKLLKEFQPDFISGHFCYPVGVWLSRMKSVQKFLITCHGPALNETPGGPRQRYGIDQLLADSMNRAAGVVAISTHARRIMERIGVRPEKIIDIPNGVDRNRLTASVDVSIRARLGIPEDAVMILSVGRESWAKAYDHGIQAFSRMAKAVPRAVYVIVGPGTGRWSQLARELDVGDRVIISSGLYGDDLMAAYQQADIFFLPSIKELCPLVVLEAMAAGLPEVVTNVSGSQDMIINGENGYVLEPGDIEGLAEALGRLAEDASMRKRMGAINREKSAGYTWDIISRKYLQHA